MAAIMPAAKRKLITELNNMVGKRIEVVLRSGKIYKGVLLGFDHPEMNLLLGDVELEERKISRILLVGDVVAEVRLLEAEIFDPKEFADYISKKLGISPDTIKVYEDANILMVGNTIRVSPSGVEGTGTLAAKINYLLKEYLDAKKRGEKPD